MPTGMWSDGTTLWIADYADNKLYAYKMSDRTRDEPKDISPPGSDNISGIASDGATLWISQALTTSDKVWAYEEIGQYLGPRLRQGHNPALRRQRPARPLVRHRQQDHVDNGPV